MADRPLTHVLRLTSNGFPRFDTVHGFIRATRRAQRLRSQGIRCVAVQFPVQYLDNLAAFLEIWCGPNGLHADLRRQLVGAASKPGAAQYA